MSNGQCALFTIAGHTRTGGFNGPLKNGTGRRRRTAEGRPGRARPRDGNFGGFAADQANPRAARRMTSHRAGLGARRAGRPKDAARAD